MRIQGVYNLLKARFLLQENAVQNWKMILFLLFLGIALIYNTHSYEQKVYQIADLTKEIRELRSKFVERRSDLMKLKMESTISNKMEVLGIKPSEVPPTKIKVVKEDKSWFNSDENNRR